MDLIKLAEALETAADIIDEQAVKIAAVDETERTEKLASLRSRIEPLLAPDAEITDEVLEKVASDESLSGLLDNLAGNPGGLEAFASSSLGDAVPAQEKTGAAREDPPEEKKTPSREKIASQVQEAGDALLAFCRSGA